MIISRTLRRWIRCLKETGQVRAARVGERAGTAVPAAGPGRTESRTTVSGATGFTAQDTSVPAGIAEQDAVAA